MAFSTNDRDLCYFARMSDAAKTDALAVLHTLRSAGFEAYFAGGCVRDLLMGQAPKDYDIATNAAPGQVRKLFGNSQAVGAAFGVILVRQKKTSIEVATFRTDLDYEDGRRPTGVRFVTAAEDAQRRDFTINGLFLDPVDNRIIDYVGGQADLTARRLRAIGDPNQRFAEDHLRLLRALRFASRFDFEIDPDTAAAIPAHAHELIRISPERIAEELRKMLVPTTRNRAYQLLRQFGFIPILMRFLPEKIPAGLEQPIDLLSLLPAEKSISFGLALAVLVLDFRLTVAGPSNPRKWLSAPEIKRAVNAMRQTFKISNDEAAEMAWSMSFTHLLGETPPTVAMLKRFLNQPNSADATALMKAIGKASEINQQVESVLASLDHWRDTDFAPPALITGDDLTAAGAAPGPKFKRALDAAYDAQLEARVQSKSEATALAMQMLSAE